MKTAFTIAMSVLLAAISHGAVVDLSNMLSDPTFDTITYSATQTYQQLPYGGWKADKTGGDYTYGPAYYVEANTAAFTVGASWYEYQVTPGSADSGNSYLGLYAPWSGGLVQMATPITMTAGNTYALSFKVRKEAGLVMFNTLLVCFTKIDGNHDNVNFFGEKVYTWGTDYTDDGALWQTLTYTYTPSQDTTGYFLIYGHPDVTAHAGMAIDTFSTIPEPMSLALTCLGGLFFMNKRHRK